MRQIIAYTSIAALALALAGCGDNDSPSAASCSGPPEVTVKGAGSEPHKLMEMTPTVGDTKGLDVKMTMGLDVRVDGDTVPTGSVPPMSFGIEMTIDDVTDDQIEMSYVYDNVDVEGGDPSIQDMLDPLAGASGTLTTTRSGAFIDGNFTASGLDPTLSQMVDQLDQQMADMAIPLPEEPVGVGAEWEAVNSITINDITTCATTSYELTEFDGNEYELAVEVSQEVVPTTVDESGVTIEVVSGSGSATGRSKGSLSMPVAVEGTSDGTTSMKMKAEQGGQKFDQDMEVDVSMEMTPRQ